MKGWPRQVHITIASYKRSMLIKNLLSFLRCMEVPNRCISIYVADKAEQRIYDTDLGWAWKACTVVGVPGLSAQRNFIVSQHPPGACLLSIDDDVTNIMVRSPECGIGMPRSQQGHWITPTEFHEMVVEGFAECINHRSYLWGICRTSNPLFINPKTFVGLTHIDGPFFGQIVRHDPDVQLKYNQSEDAERTLRFYQKDGGVVRLGGYGFYPPSTKLNPGGLQEMGLDARYKLKDRVTDQLVEEFPLLCSREEPNPKYPFPGIKLKRIRSLL